MAKLKATPKNFEQASEVLAGRESIRLGNNTYLENFYGGIAVRLHNTRIVWFHEDGRVTLHTDGYHTVTTKERINQFIDGRVYQQHGQWYYRLPLVEGAIEGAVTVIFSEGLNVGAK